MVSDNANATSSRLFSFFRPFFEIQGEVVSICCFVLFCWGGGGADSVCGAAVSVSADAYIV